MDQLNVINVTNISKKFVIKNTNIFGGTTKSGSIEVLKGLSFSLKQGEVLGIIGKNGSGKSTLLKILTGIMGPDSGDVKINGNVGSILELGIGFDGEITGRDNIRMKCSLYGLSKQEIDDNIEEIINFSEIGDQIDHPLRTYSSGMRAKLAFSVLTFVKSNILILDEVLSVGDSSFNAKCILAFQKMKKEGRSILLASHNISILEKMCDRVMWIDKGKVKLIGDPNFVCYKYESDLTDSIETVTSLANSGDITAMCRAGIMYRDGITVEKNINLAINYLEKASNLGHIESTVYLADILMKDGRINDARVLYEKASKTGNSDAIMALSQIGDDKKSMMRERIRGLAEKGNTRAIKMLADMLFYGISFTQDRTEAIKWYLKSAEYNNSHSLFQLGLCYRDGIGIDKNPKLGVDYLIKSAHFGYNPAKFELANTYRKGIGVTNDVRNAILWYEQAAISGDPRAMFELGTMYRDGNGIEIDQQKSEMWMKRYSNFMISRHELTLGDIMTQSQNKMDYEEGIMWYEQASKDGNNQANSRLANIYREAYLTKPDTEKSIEYFEKASISNDPYSMCELALEIMKKNSDSKQYEYAIKLLFDSSWMNYRKSMITLLNMSQYNDSLDREQLNKVLILLSELGDSNAKIKLSCEKSTNEK